MASFLDPPFTMEEIKRAVWDSGSEKAPGPNGLNFKLIKEHLEILKEEIFNFIQYFKKSSKIGLAYMQLLLHLCLNQRMQWP